MRCWSDTRLTHTLRCIGVGSWLAAVAGPAVAAGGPVDSAAPPDRLDERAALLAGDAVVGTLLPEHTLIDRRGRPVLLSSYRGKPLLVSFIYTGCFQVCPATTRALLDAVNGLDKLLPPNRYNVVSIGFNQPFDSPTAMRAFAAQHRIDHANWEFLSPPPAAVGALTRSFGFSFVATPAGFDHVLAVTLVDAQGRVHSQVYGDRMNAQRIGEPLRQLLTEGATPVARSQLADAIERVRILCTVYDPATGQYRYDYALLAEVVGGLLFFISVALYFGAEWRNRRRARLPPAVSQAAAGSPP